MEDTQRGYFPALDGLRAFAVGAVLLFHAGHLSGGFLGVDTFFVISGFLITGLLLREVEQSGTIRLGAFWARRARRLLPALALMVCVVTLWSIRYGTPSERLALHGDTLWSLSFLMNWHEVAAAHDYWSAFALQSPLTHLWSLAVEEQFYLVWPLVAIAVARLARRPQRTMFIVCSVGTVASFALMAVLYDPHASTRVYEGTDARIGAMLIGGLCATNAVRNFIARLATSAKRRLSSTLGYALTLASVGVLWLYSHAHGSDSWLFRGGFFMFALAIGLVISAITVAAEHRTGPVRSRLVAALSVRPLRSIGRLSYGLYLWHWPIFLALSPTRTGLSEWPLLVARLVVTAVIAVMSFQLIEQPVRLSLQRLPQWVSAPATALAVGLAAVMAVTVALPEASATAVNLQGIAALAAAPHETNAESVSARSARDSTPDAGSQRAPTTTVPIIKHGIVRTVVLFGDSIAYTTSPGIEAAFQAAGVSVMSAAGPGVGLINNSGFFDFLRNIDANTYAQSVLVVVQLSVWDAKYGEEQQYQSLSLLHQFLLDRHAQLAIATPPPLRPDQDKGGYDALTSAAQHLVRDWPTDVTFFDSSEVWGKRYNADLNNDHVPERMYDGVHICPSGAALVGAWLVASTARYYDGITPADVTVWAAGPWTQNPIYSSPPGTCAAV